MFWNLSGYMIVPYILQLFCLVHILKTRRDTFWIWIIIFLPIVGGIAYVVLEMLPYFNLRQRQFKALQEPKPQSIFAGRRIKMLEEQVKFLDTFENRKALADEYLGAEECERARELYISCLTGIHKDDATAKLGLAKSGYELKKYTEAKEALQSMRDNGGNFVNNPEAQRLYFKVIEEVDPPAAVSREYEQVTAQEDKFEFAYMYARYLRKQNETEKAKEILKGIINRGDQLKRLGVRFDRSWMKAAQNELKMVEK